MGLIYMRFIMDNIALQKINPNRTALIFTEHLHAPQRRHLFHFGHSMSSAPRSVCQLCTLEIKNDCPYLNKVCCGQCIEYELLL